MKKKKKTNTSNQYLRQFVFFIPSKLFLCKRMVNMIYAMSKLKGDRKKEEVKKKCKSIFQTKRSHFNCL